MGCHQKDKADRRDTTMVRQAKEEGDDAVCRHVFESGRNSSGTSDAAQIVNNEKIATTDRPLLTAACFISITDMTRVQSPSLGSLTAPQSAENLNWRPLCVAEL
jgi:hypothetical protein